MAGGGLPTPLAFTLAPSIGRIVADTPTTRQARRREKLRASGLTQVLVTIPNTPSAKDAIRALAKKLRGEK